MVRMYIEDGMGLTSIANRFNCSQPAVRNNIKRAGHKMRVMHTIPAEDKERMVAMYVSEGVGIATVAKMFGCGQNTVKRAVIASGHSMRGREEGKVTSPMSNILADRKEADTLKLIRDKAARRVNNAVTSGKLPNIRTQKCNRCDAGASNYHHWSYKEEHWLDVEPLCLPCHRKEHSETNMQRWVEVL